MSASPPGVSRIYVEGVGLWSRQLADFSSLRSLLAGVAPTPPPARPAAATLPPNERRRAPESVLLAVEVAAQAVAMSGRDAATLACVFASSHGDQPITDYMCATLARAPAELSPIRFHNSVHNAPVGYWTIATGCHAPSTAVAAQHASFGAGLLEAVSQVLAEHRAVLLVCSDTGGSGPLDEVTGCRQPFGCALVLAPQAGPSTLARLDLQLTAAGVDPPLEEPLAGWRAGNPSAAGLPLLALLAGGPGGCQLAAAATLGVRIDKENVA
ncbi:beta-ketoacyl synthase chain length factor [Rhodanobacter umsongensis]|uniref:Beta-ketoacyl synthase chain length factor n=1 Tax=Rhodanobacter umsongensis TaxID=633153 RepID=A0ABW0JLQ9_9GAMM